MQLSALLERSARSLSEAGPEAALPSLLDAWRGCRLPRVAALVERCSATAEKPRGPVEGKTAKARAARCLELLAAADPVDLPRVLRALRTLPFGEAAKIVDAIAAPQDPRVLPEVLALLQDPPWVSSSSHKFWRGILKLLVAQHDPRAPQAIVAVDLQRIMGGGWAADHLQEIVQRAAAKMKDEVPATTAEDDRACVDLEARLAQRTRAGEDLLARIQANPADDGLRSVWADSLLERGDPRGEFVTLQLARRRGEATEAQRKREAQLVAEHDAEWLGGLSVAVAEHRFEGGLLDQVRLDVSKLSEPPAELSTVREITLWGAEGQPFPAAFLRHPALRSLQALWNVQAGQIADLRREEGWALTGLGFDVPGSDRKASAREQAWLADLSMFPLLRDVALDGYWPKDLTAFRWFWETPTAQRLSSVRISHGLRGVAGFLAEQERIPRNVACLETSFDHGWYAWTVRLLRGGDGRFSRLAGVLRPSRRDFQRSTLDDLVEQVLDRVPTDAFEEMVVLVEGARATAKECDLVVRAAERQTRLRSLRLPGRDPIDVSASRRPGPPAPTLAEERAAEAAGMLAAFRARLEPLVSGLREADARALLALDPDVPSTHGLVAEVLTRQTSPGAEWADLCFTLLELPGGGFGPVRRSLGQVRVSAAALLAKVKPKGSTARLMALLRVPDGAWPEVLNCLPLFDPEDLPALFDWFTGLRGRRDGGPPAHKAYYGVQALAVQRGDATTLADLRARLASGAKFTEHQRWAYEQAEQELAARLAG